MRWRSIKIGTPLAMFVGITIFLAIAAVNSQANPLFFALGFLIGAILLSPFLAWQSIRKVIVTRNLPEVLYSGEPADIYYEIENLRKRTPSLALRIGEVSSEESDRPALTAFVPMVRGGHHHTLHIRYPHMKRGPFTLEAIEISSGFPFGLFVLSRHFSAPAEMIVLPRVGILQRDLFVRLRQYGDDGPVASRRTGGNDEFFGLRDYRPGDPLRMIYWRRSARQGKLTVREMSVNSPPEIILSLVAKPTSDRALYESAIELAATLAVHYIDHGYGVGLALPNGQSIAPMAGVHHRQTLLHALATFDGGAEQVGRQSAKNASFTPFFSGKSQWASIVIAPSLGDTVGMVGLSATATVLTMDDPDRVHWVSYLKEDRKDHDERQTSVSSGKAGSVQS